MNDDRTPEQQAADEALVEAVMAAARAHGSLSDGAVLTRCMVVGTGIGMADDGDDTTIRIVLIPYGGAMDWTTTLGMLRGATLQLEHDYLYAETDEYE